MQSAMRKDFMDTDAQVFQDIVAELKNSPILHYAQLRLQVQDGIVTISGRVNSLGERKAVERAAKRVTGIKTLILEIRAAAIPMIVKNANAGTQKDTARKEFG
jgi:osmotically-inducible protein OsmY